MKHTMFNFYTPHFFCKDAIKYFKVEYNVFTDFVVYNNVYLLFIVYYFTVIVK